MRRLGASRPSARPPRRRPRRRCAARSRAARAACTAGARRRTRPAARRAGRSRRSGLRPASCDGEAIAPIEADARERRPWQTRRVAMERHIVGLGGGGDTAEQTRLLYEYVLAPDREGAAAAPLRPDRRRGLGRGDRRLLRALPRRRRAQPSLHLSLAAGGPARADPLPGRDLRQRRQHREHARDLADARHRRAPARGLGERGRALRRERRDDLLVRGGRHRLVRPAARAAWTASASWPAAPARTTTARSSAGRATASSSTAGFPEGIAADDGVGLHYVGTELREVVTCRPGAAAYRVTRDGEEKLPTRQLRLAARRERRVERAAGRLSSL